MSTNNSILTSSCLSNILNIYREGIVSLHTKRDNIDSEHKTKQLVELIKITYSCLSVFNTDNHTNLNDLQSCYTMLDDLAFKNLDNTESVDDAILMPELSVLNNNSDEETSIDSDNDNTDLMNNLNRGIDPNEAFKMMNDDKKKENNKLDAKLVEVNSKANRGVYTNKLSKLVLDEYADDLEKNEK